MSCDAAFSLETLIYALPVLEHKSITSCSASLIIEISFLLVSSFIYCLPKICLLFFPLFDTIIGIIIISRYNLPSTSSVNKVQICPAPFQTAIVQTAFPGEHRKATEKITCRPVISICLEGQGLRDCSPFSFPKTSPVRLESRGCPPWSCCGLLGYAVQKAN